MISQYTDNALSILLKNMYTVVHKNTPWTAKFVLILVKIAVIVPQIVPFVKMSNVVENNVINIL